MTTTPLPDDGVWSYDFTFNWDDYHKNPDLSTVLDETAREFAYSAMHRNGWVAVSPFEFEVRTMAHNTNKAVLTVKVVVECIL